MKKRISLLLLAAILTTGCGSDLADREPKADRDIVESGKSVNEKSRIYTTEDIYLKSFECGYISEYRKIRYATVIIETKEQLDYAEEYYGLKNSDSASDDHSDFVSPFASLFQEMKALYPLEEYNYVFSYDEVSSGGYYYHADKLEITEDAIRFLMDNESYAPKAGEDVSCVMGGFAHMAAVPKEYMVGYTFGNAIYPGEKRPPSTGLLYAYIPQRFLTEESYEGWVTP